MDNKIIVHAFNGTKRYGDREKRNCHCWAELILLYNDGTWEKIFEYRWTDYFNNKVFNSGRLTNLTRAEALVKLEQEYYSGKLEGIFMD